MKIRRPIGVSKPLLGEVYLPPTPLHLGPLAAKVGPDSSIRTLYVYWGLTLAQSEKSCGAKRIVFFGSILAHFEFFDLYSYIGAIF